MELTDPSLNLSLQVAGAPIFHYHNPPEWKWVSRRRSHYNLWVLIGGAGRMRIDHSAYEIEPGFAALLHPDQEVQAESKGEIPIANLGLHFYLDAKPDQEITEAIGTTTRLLHLPLIMELARYFEEGARGQHRRRPEEQRQIAIQILRIYASDFRLGSEDPVQRALRNLYQEIRMHPGRTWIIARLAKMMELSVSQFERRFRKMTGETPLSCVIRSRMESACSLLLNSSLRIGEISELLGYSDVAYFSRQFRNKTGLSPLGYRKKGSADQKSVF